MIVSDFRCMWGRVECFHYSVKKRFSIRRYCTTEFLNTHHQQGRMVVWFTHDDGRRRQKTTQNTTSNGVQTPKTKIYTCPGETDEAYHTFPLETLSCTNGSNISRKECTTVWSLWNQGLWWRFVVRSFWCVVEGEDDVMPDSNYTV